MYAGEKDALRARFRQVRHDLGSDARAAADVAICERIAGMPQWRDAALVLTYLSFGAEVDTRGIIRRAWDADKVVALPRCVPHTRLMEWYRVESLDGLVRSPFGVEEPGPDPALLVDPLADATSLALVPGLTFDAAGYRLGYGGGFYDTFLTVYPGTSVGLCRNAQLVDDLRALGVIDAHDLPVDAVVTETSAFD